MHSTGLRIAAAGGVAALVLASDKEKARQAQLAAHSTYRVVNLVTTAGLMAGDYAFHIYFTHADQRDLVASKRRLLGRMQDDQETFTLRLLEEQRAHALHPIPSAPSAVSSPSFWLRRIADNRTSMDELTEEIAVLLECGGDRFSEVHVRIAHRLRNMCASNG
jgi:hypothetical protein